MIILICFALIPCIAGFRGLFMNKVFPEDKFKCALMLLGGGIGSLICYACIELYIKKLIRGKENGS